MEIGGVHRRLVIPDARRCPPPIAVTKGRGHSGPLATLTLPFYSPLLLPSPGLRNNFYESPVLIVGHELIAQGIYQHTRHPIYLGTMLATMGIPMCVASVYGLLVMLVLVPLFFSRIKSEERTLIEEFGAEYRAYMETRSS